MSETRETLADVLRYYGVERERGVLFVPAEPGPVECATEVDAVRVLLRLADHDANVAEKELDALAERLRTAEREREVWREKARFYGGACGRAEARVASLEAALRRYGQHEDGCCHEVSRFCDCGLDVLLSAAPVQPGELDESDQTAVDCWTYWHEYAEAMHEDTLAADGLPRSDAIWECGRTGWLLSALDAMRAVQPEAARGETPRCTATLDGNRCTRIAGHKGVHEALMPTAPDPRYAVCVNDRPAPAASAASEEGGEHA